MRLLDGISSRIISLLLDTELAGARFVLMLSSFLWALFLLLPGDGFARPLYLPMKQLASETFWGGLFVIHACATFIATYFRLRSRCLVLLEGALGLAIYTVSALSVLVMADLPAPMLAPQIACAVAAFWILARYMEKR